jgi:hypothetical protein
MAIKRFTNKKRSIRNSKKGAKSYRKQRRLTNKTRKVSKTRKLRKSNPIKSIFSNLFK